MAATAEPPTKKVKMPENVDEYIETITNSKTNLTAILHDEFYESIPLVKYYAGHIKDPQLISKTMQILNDRLPLKELQHLKKVLRGCILLCSVDYFESTHFDSIQAFIEEDWPELKNIFNFFREVEIPMKAPLTKKQQAECNQWSCKFHPNTYIEKLLSKTLFTPDQVSSHRMYMGMVLHIAKMCLNTNDCTVTTDDFLSSYINVAIVVDSTTNSVVEVAYDNRHEHPIQHAAMVAIDNVAKTQSGGSWISDNILEKKIKDELKSKFTDTLFGLDKDSDPKPYLCTGYNIYLLREPCLMCAMGLLHARAKRVFFMYKNTHQGALQTKTKLHCLSGLNHRYEVFTGFNESMEALTEPTKYDK